MGFYVTFCRLLYHFFALIEGCSGVFWGCFSEKRMFVALLRLPPPPLFGVFTRLVLIRKIPTENLSPPTKVSKIQKNPPLQQHNPV